MQQLIKKPVVSEKSFAVASLHKFCFWADKKATKEEIAKMVEDLYKVNVVAVNTQNISGKIKRSRGKIGKRNDLKKVTVTLKAGQKIAIFEAESEEKVKKEDKKKSEEKKNSAKTEKITARTKKNKEE